MKTWQRKDLLGIQELSVDEINFLLDSALAFKQVGERFGEEGAVVARQAVIIYSLNHRRAREPVLSWPRTTVRPMSSILTASTSSLG